MRAIATFAALGIATSALATGAPAAAQYAGYGPYYGGQDDPYVNRYPGNRQIAVNRCAQEVQARLGSGHGGAYGYGGRVLGISRVDARGYGGAVTVRGVASSGRYDDYGYDERSPVDLTWRCTADLHGFVMGISIEPAERNFGKDYGYREAPYADDYAQYGYRRY